MNPIHAHLILNHVPVFGVPIGMSLLAYAVIRRSDELQRLGFLVFAVTAAIAIPVYFSGVGAETLTKTILGLPGQFIHLHEQSAEKSMVALIILGSLSSWGLFRFRRESRLPNRLVLICFVLSIACCASLVRTAYLGGQLRHSEIMPGWKESP